MTASNFDRSLAAVLKHEGGFVNHPADPGGATNKGITLGTFRRYVKKGGSVSDLKNITDNQVAVCYRKHYWDAVKADDLPSGLDYAVFDFAVNSGPSRAIKFLQNALNVAADGKIGPVTLAAVGKDDPTELIKDVCDMRLSWLKGLGTWSTFGKGWTNRVVGVKSLALKMNAFQGAPAIPPPPDANAEPPEEVVKPDIEPQGSSEPFLLRFFRALWAVFKGE